MIGQNYQGFNEASAQGAVLCAGRDRSRMADKVPTPPIQTIGEEIDRMIDLCQARVERLQLVKSKFAKGEGLTVTLQELSKALHQY